VKREPVLQANPRAVVTGGGSGLGRAFCLVLADRGAQARVCDVRSLDEVTALSAAADDLCGGVDLIINNAGVAVGGPVGETPIQDWRWIVDVNLWGVIHGCHVFAPRLAKQGRGGILNVASAAGLLCPPALGPYNVTKAGVVALSETLSAELSERGVAVTVLCPTFFRTNLMTTARSVDEKARTRVDKLMSVARIDAEGVARKALLALEARELYAVPMADGRLMWRLKRLAPGSFYGLAGKLQARLKKRDRAEEA